MSTSNTRCQAASEGLSTALHTLKQDRWYLLATFVGMLMLAGGFKLLAYPDVQVRAYNVGVTIYKKESATPEGSMTKAIKFFDLSLHTYKTGQKAPWLERFIYPYPSTEVAARANFQKAKALLLNRQAEQCAEAFQEGLRLNPGNNYKGFFWESFVPLIDLHLVTAYDLELLYKARPDIAQAQGKNKGKKPGPPAEPEPADDPTSAAGKGNPDDI